MAREVGFPTNSTTPAVCPRAGHSGRIWVVHRTSLILSIFLPDNYRE